MNIYLRRFTCIYTRKLRANLELQKYDQPKFEVTAIVNSDVVARFRVNYSDWLNATHIFQSTSHPHAQVIA